MKAFVKVVRLSPVGFSTTIVVEQMPAQFLRSAGPAVARDPETSEDEPMRTAPMPLALVPAAHALLKPDFIAIARKAIRLK